MTNFMKGYDQYINGVMHCKTIVRGLYWELENLFNMVDKCTLNLNQFWQVSLAQVKVSNKASFLIDFSPFM